MRYFTSDHHFFHKNILKYQREYRPFRSIEMMNNELIRRWNQTVQVDDEIYYLGDFSLCTQVSTAHAILRKLNGIKYLVKGNHDPAAFGDEGFEWVKDETEIFLRPATQTSELPVRLCHYPYVDVDFVHMTEDGLVRFSANGALLKTCLQNSLEDTIRELKDYDAQRAFLLSYYGIELHESQRDLAEPLRGYLARLLKRFTWRRPRPDGRWLLHGHVHGLWQCKPSERMVNVSVERWDLRPVSEVEIIELMSSNT